MERILLAVGFRQLEEYLERQLRHEFQFVGTTVHREGIIRAIGQKNPNIVIVRETLEGRENILSVIYQIRTKFPKIRVIFIAGNREPGDALLANLVSYGVYDILHGEKIKAQEVMALLRNPNEYKDVQHLQPKPVLDEDRNEVLFESPDILTKEKEIVKEVIKEVYLDNEGSPVAPRGSAREPDDDLYEEIEQISEEVMETLQTKREVEEEVRASMPEKSAEKSSFFSKFLSKEEAPESKDNRGWFGGNKTANSKEKIIAFMGAKGGVGNTSIALNFAMHLASKKNRVIYLEMNDRTPAVRYWYELGKLEDGIDKALIGIERNQYELIEQSIIQSKELKHMDAELSKSYRKFPDTLDFLFFSNRFLTRNEDEKLPLHLVKELYLYLLFQMQYDYVILDVSADMTSEYTLSALMYSHSIFITVTQDVSTIGNSVYLSNELAKKGIHISRKGHYIVNKFDKTDLTPKDIAEWVKVDEVITVPCQNRDYINANFIGLPMYFASKNTQLRSALGRIEKKL